MVLTTPRGASCPREAANPIRVVMISLNGITNAVLFCIAGDTTSTESARYGWTTRRHASKCLNVHGRGRRRACQMEIWVSTTSVQTRRASKKALLSSAAPFKAPPIISARLSPRPSVTLGPTKIALAARRNRLRRSLSPRSPSSMYGIGPRVAVSKLQIACSIVWAVQIQRRWWWTNKPKVAQMS